MPHAAYHIPHAPCHTVHSAHHAPHACRTSRHISHAARHTPHATCRTSHVARFMTHAAYHAPHYPHHIPHTANRMPHSICSTSHSTCSDASLSPVHARENELISGCMQPRSIFFSRSPCRLLCFCAVDVKVGCVHPRNIEAVFNVLVECLFAGFPLLHCKRLLRQEATCTQFQRLRHRNLPFGGIWIHRREEDECQVRLGRV